MMKATCIEWDTEGIDIDLPTEMEIPDYFIDEDGEPDYEGIEDYLSNETGFCHFGYVLEEE